MSSLHRCQQVIVNGVPMEFISALDQPLDHDTDDYNVANTPPPPAPPPSLVTSRKRPSDRSDSLNVPVCVADDDALRPVRILVVVPGNPGSATFYRSFGEQLASQLAWDEHHTFDDVLVWSYAGFTTLSTPACPYSIDREAEHLREFLEHVRSDLGTAVEFWLVGHSIGAYLALDLMATFDAVTNAVLLFPFLVFDDKAPISGKQQLAKTLLSAPLFHKTVTKCYSLLPRTVKRALVNTVSGPLTDEAREAAVECFAGHSDLLFSVSYTAMTEFQTLPSGMQGLQEKYVPFLRQNRHRIWALYTSGDTWAPLWQADVLESNAGIPVQRFGSKVGVPHAFCVSDVGTALVTDGVVRAVRSMCSSERPAKRAKLATA